MDTSADFSSSRKMWISVTSEEISYLQSIDCKFVMQDIQTFATLLLISGQQWAFCWHAKSYPYTLCVCGVWWLLRNEMDDILLKSCQWDHKMLVDAIISWMFLWSRVEAAQEEWKRMREFSKLWSAGTKWSTFFVNSPGEGRSRKTLLCARVIKVDSLDGP